MLTLRAGTESVIFFMSSSLLSTCNRLIYDMMFFTVNVHLNVNCLFKPAVVCLKKDFLSKKKQIILEERVVQEACTKSL